MIIRANASINLALDVGERGKDGYHTVDLVSVPLDLHDILEVTEIPASTDTYLLEDDPTIICEETELAYIALRLMKKEFPIHKGFRIQIYKRIPPEAGLGGGYADAAGVINAICRIYRIKLDDPRVQSICDQVGAGVSLAMKNVPARGSGSREKPEELTGLSLDYGVLLVKPAQGIDTEDIFEKYDLIPAEEREHADIPALIEALRSGDEDAIAANMVNSLLKPGIGICEPIETILKKMVELGFPMCTMSSTGSTCFCLSRDKKALREARSVFEEMGFGTLLTRTLVPRERFGRRKS